MPRFRYVNEFTVPSSRLARWTDVTPADIVACQGASGAGWVAGGLRPEDVVVHNLKIDWAKGAKNPVDHVSFYDDYGRRAGGAGVGGGGAAVRPRGHRLRPAIPPLSRRRPNPTRPRLCSQDKFHIPKEKVSSLIPDVFQERKARPATPARRAAPLLTPPPQVRVYSKNADSRFVEAVDAAFDAYQRREYGGLASQHRTPSKPSRKRAAPGDADGATAATTPACAASQPGAGGGRGGGGGGGGGGGTGGGLAGAAAAAAAGGAAAGLRSVVAALAFSAAVGEGGTPSWPTS